LNRYPIILALILCCAPLPLLSPALAQKAEIDLSPRKKGPSSGLPMPRFVSLKADEVNVRKGPGWDHAVAWIFRRAGLPVEVIAEFDVWRQVRDSEGATGWVIGSLLSGRRTVLVAPWQGKGKTIDLHGTAGKSAQVARSSRPASWAMSRDATALGAGSMRATFRAISARSWCGAPIPEKRSISGSGAGWNQAQPSIQPSSPPKRG